MVLTRANDGESAISDINLRLSKKPEFDSWRWIEHTEPAKLAYRF